MINKKRPPRVIILCGPTAVGKSAILYRLLDDGFEIINADSMQVYKHMNIGSAKPTKEELDKIPHHLVDFLLPSERFSAGDFIRGAGKYIEEISSRGRIPVISGGTAFYLKSFLYQLPGVPKGSEEIREELRIEAERKGKDELYRQLVEIDPEYAAKISSNDLLRISRALEVHRVTGKPLSSFKPPETMREDYEFLFVGLRRPRGKLYERINQRVDRMFETGLVEEIKSLIEKGYSETDPGMRGIGYKEFFEMIKFSFTLEEVRRLIKRNSRRYAKRQLTFFNAFPGVRWIHPGETAEIAGLIKGFV